MIEQLQRIQSGFNTYIIFSHFAAVKEIRFTFVNPIDWDYNLSVTISILTTCSQATCLKANSSSSTPVAGFTTLLPVGTRFATARITGLLLFRGLVRSASIAGGRTTARISQSSPASSTSRNVVAEAETCFTTTSDP